MPTSIVQPSTNGHVRLSDVGGKMVKAGIRKPDTAAYYADLGGCIAEVMRVFGLTLKEFAHECGKDERQVSRWIEGTDRPQIECVFAVARFRPAMVIAMAKLAAGVQVDTVISIRRSA